MHDLEQIDIKEIIPQRYPFLLIDKILEFKPREKAVVLKNVSINEGYFQGHFEGMPIMPGVLIIEAMAQAAIPLFYQQSQPKKKQIYYLGSVKARFLHPVFPGDQLKITAEPRKIISGLAVIQTTAQVEDKEVARGELSFSVKQE